MCVCVCVINTYEFEIDQNYEKIIVTDKLSL